jgi:hypothetical protein
LILLEFATNFFFSKFDSSTECPKKRINIKQYLSTSHFLVDNRYIVIISSRKTQLYITKVFDTQFSWYDYQLSDVWCGVFFYSLINFNQKILILSWFVTKNDFSYVIIPTELCIKYFCNIKLCFTWRYDDNISVIY